MITVTVYERTFPGRMAGVRQAREWIAGLAAGSRRAADIRLCVSELAANAVLHSFGTYTITVALSDSVMTVTVTDSGPAAIPKPRRSPEESGRGLLLVGALSDRFFRDGCEAVAVFDL